MEREEQLEAVYKLFVSIKETIPSERYRVFLKEKKVEFHGAREKQTN